jgi:glycerophosphoryl diester phosphodiesterase
VHPDVRGLRGGRAAAFVDAAHHEALRVHVWTVNDPERIRRLAGAGVDAVITDVPDVARAALGR